MLTLGYKASAEQFPPSQLLDFSIEAETAGFDSVFISDHLQPWWEGGESGNAWFWLGAAAQATDHVLFGTGVTPPGPRYHPALIAQAEPRLVHQRRRLQGVLCALAPQIVARDLAQLAVDEREQLGCRGIGRRLRHRETEDGRCWSS